MDLSTTNLSRDAVLENESSRETASADLSLDSESVYESAKESNGNSTLEKKGSDSISSPEKKASDAVMPTSDSQEEEEEELVFCDATKQLLVRHLPPVLTLHLKRFLQEGRRLRKNGCHIEFPDLLDMAPYCVDHCQVYDNWSQSDVTHLYALAPSLSIRYTNHASKMIHPHT